MLPRSPLAPSARASPRSALVEGAALATTNRVAVAPTDNSLPSISGPTNVGATLTANAGTWSGSSPIAYQYQWLSCDSGGASCTAISGATTSTYGPVSGDAYRRCACR